MSVGIISSNQFAGIVTGPLLGPDGKIGNPALDGLVTASKVPVSFQRAFDTALMALASPDDDMDINIATGMIDAMLSQEQAKSGKFGIALSVAQKEEYLAKAKKLFDQGIEKLKESEAKLLENKDWSYAKAILGVLGAIAGLVGAVAMGVTGVGLAPAILLGTGATLGLLVAVGELGTLIAEDQGTTVTSLTTGKQQALKINFEGLIDRITEQQEVDGTLVVQRKNTAGEYVNYRGEVIPDQNPMWNAKPGALVMEEDTFNDYKKGWAMASMAIMVAMTVAGGVWSFRNASKAIDGIKALNALDKSQKASVTVQRVEQGAELLGASADIAGGGAAIKKADNDTLIAEAQKAGDDARNEAEFTQAQSANEQGRWNLHLEAQRKRAETYDENGKRRLDVTANQHDVSNKISQRI